MYNLQLPHGRHCHGGQVAHGDHVGHVGHGGRCGQGSEGDDGETKQKKARTLFSGLE